MKNTECSSYFVSDLFSLAGPVHDDVGGVDVEVVLEAGDAAVVTLEHARRADGAQVKEVDVLNVALDRVEARLAVGSVVDLVASCCASLSVICGEQRGGGDWGKSGTSG